MLELHAPLITPYNDRERIDLDAFARNLAWYETQPLDGYLINGSSGEAEMLTSAEQRELLQHTLALTRRPVLAGVSATSSYATLSEIEQLDGLALSGILLRTPSYFGSQLDQVSYYIEVAEHSAYPLLVYQIPQNTGVKLEASALDEIAAHPNIIGIKDSLGDLTLLQESSRPESFRYLLGAANLLLPGVRAGANGGILALANVVPTSCRRLLELIEAEEWTQAQELQCRLIPLNRALGGSQGYGIAGLKAAVAAVGLTGGYPRRPLKKITAPAEEQIRSLVETVSASTCNR